MNFIRMFFHLLAILLIAPWPLTYVHGYNDTVARLDAVQVVHAGPSVEPNLDNTREPPHCYSYTIPKIRDYVESNTGQHFPHQLYVVPEDQAIEAIAARIDGARDAYKVAVQWIYVSDQKLSHVSDKWLTAHEFLTNTLHYPSNPVQGKMVSDCEEQAYALVSLIRAEGIRPEEVRVALGEVEFDGREMGHAWVELLTNGHWLVLDPSCGPYWDDKLEKLVHRRGVPFDYYASHTYPVTQVWAYYNDIYYLDLRDNSGSAPASWLCGVKMASPVSLLPSRSVPVQLWVQPHIMLSWILLDSPNSDYTLRTRYYS